MFNFDSHDLQRFGFAAVAALILTTASVGAAVGPATPLGAQPLAAPQSVMPQV